MVQPDSLNVGWTIVYGSLTAGYQGELMRILAQMGCAPTPPREPMRGMRRDEAGKHRGHRQAPSDAQDPRYMCYGMHWLPGHGHGAPPVVVS